MKNYHFSGYATKNNLKCSDGRIIRKDAFKDCDGATVPLVWQHLHNEPGNILGHAVLENRSDGVYAYATFNESVAGKNAKMLVEHGDITALSIYANELVEKDKNVVHGTIRELSLVLAGANPGARIDFLSIQHSDGSFVDLDDEAIIYNDLTLEHANSNDGEAMSKEDMTVGEVFETLTEVQKTAVYAIIAEATGASDEEDSAEHSDDEGEKFVKHNLFDNDEEDRQEKPHLTHDQFAAIMADAQKRGSFREAFFAHAQTYGIENIAYLFPDAKTVTPTPDMIARKMGWVSGIINGTRHTPFSRIKSMAADITADEARALGYVKGNLKKEEVIRLLKRVTTPTTIYKKQKLDRDDIVDITDLDVVAWLKAEMRMMLDEELARAILIGDGRALEVNGAANPDKIDETCIRPIWKDEDMYAHKILVGSTKTTTDIMEAILRARSEYKGSGDPTLYTTSAFLTDMLLLKDKNDRRYYMTEAEVASALRVSRIVEVPVMEGVKREVTDPAPATIDLVAIIVNPQDYTVGADKGGAVNFFDDFDIDYNQYKYLLETRCSGCLTHPKSAIIVEQVAAAG